MRLPWQNESLDWLVGIGAKDLADEKESQVIHSAKSWLSQNTIDRTEKFLPWKSADVVGEDCLSPLEASSLLLRHMKEAWNHEMNASSDPESEFSSQQITVTVPASFSEDASRLTLEAASIAGYPEVSLLEEPMSAFYSLKNKSFEAKDRILVFDMGGGTTDFSLFEASSQKDIKRLKVSDHILLGGDNVDLYIAKILESKAKAENKEISKRDWAQLKAQARFFKRKP